jgi:hypothetical protein
MKILFLGNANNPLILNLAAELKRADSSITIDIIAVNESAGEAAVNTFNRIWITGTPSGLWNRKILKTIWMMRRFRNVLKSVDTTYDFLHMFFMHVGFSGSADILQRIARRRIVSVFGSELYRSPDVVIRKLKSLVAIADHVTAANPDTLVDFIKRFQYPQEKTSVCRFGLQPLRYIEKLKGVTKSEHKKASGFDPDSFVITCGYNASPGQQHHSIIAALKNLKSQLPEKYILLFPMAMEDAVKAAGLTYRFTRNFLPDEDLAYMRCATDVMIQIQITDQLAGAMQEHLYAGNVVVTGSWLPYKVLDDSGIVYWKTESAERLTATLADVLAHYSEYLSQIGGNSSVIGKLSSWPETIKNWSGLYR